MTEKRSKPQIRERERLEREQGSGSRGPSLTNAFNVVNRFIDLRGMRYLKRFKSETVQP